MAGISARMSRRSRTAASSKISIETSDQIREMGEAVVTHAEAIRSEANALADSILEQGRLFSDRVAAFTNTAQSMLVSMNEQRGKLHKG